LAGAVKPGRRRLSRARIRVLADLALAFGPLDTIGARFAALMRRELAQIAK
jgi:hypothetical protein